MNAYFESLYREHSDPYFVRTRWYERRKRALLLATLPLERYANAFEPGCGTAELSVELAARCDRLLCSDFSAAAVAAARRRTVDMDHVCLKQQSMPTDWPHGEGPFDLIVISEFGYFLDADAMVQLAECCRRSMTAAGTLVACDWRADFEQRTLSTEAVHKVFQDLGLPSIARHEEADFLLQVWSTAGISVAQHGELP